MSTRSKLIYLLLVMIIALTSLATATFSALQTAGAAGIEGAQSAYDRLYQSARPQAIAGDCTSPGSSTCGGG